MTARRLEPQLAAQLRALLATATPATIPSGVLVWFGAGPIPDGGPASPPLGQPGWQACYAVLESGALAPGVVKPLAELLALLAGYRPDGPLPLALAHFHYDVPSVELMARIHRAAEENRPLRDPPATLAGQTEQRIAFFCCGMLHAQWGRVAPAYRGRRVPFLLTPSMLLSNGGASPPEAVEIDPGDGGGFRTIEPEGAIVAEYSSGTAADVSLRSRYGGQTLLASFTFALSDEPAAPAPDEQWPLKASGCGNTGTAHVYRSHPAREPLHPLIMVEGFPGGHPADEIYETLNQQGTADKLRARGYDIVIVGLDRGADHIQHNAEVLIECIREAIARTTAPLVVGGLSMGGLVSRYALLRMEHDGEDHNASVFLTIDTPHEGAYTSLAAQWFVRAFAADLPGLALYSMLLESPANQQFDRWVLCGEKAGVSALRQRFVQELADLGDYPQAPRRLAIACGSGDGVATGTPGTRTLEWDAEPWLSVTLAALSGAPRQVLGRGHWFLSEPQELSSLRFIEGAAWDVAPGGQDFYNAEIAAIARGTGCGAVTAALPASCAVPTVSALGIKGDPFAPVPPVGPAAPAPAASPFHDYAFADADHPHLTLTPALSEWLLAALGAPRATLEEARV